MPLLLVPFFCLFTKLNDDSTSYLCSECVHLDQINVTSMVPVATIDSIFKHLHAFLHSLFVVAAVAATAAAAGRSVTTVDIVVCAAVVQRLHLLLILIVWYW